MEQSKEKTPFLMSILGLRRKGRAPDIIESESPKIDRVTLNSRLYNAVEIGNIAEMKKLLGQEADPNTKDRHGGWTLLHHAASNGNEKACRLLVEHGANVNAMTDSTNTPLFLARMAGNTKAAEYLESVGGKFIISTVSDEKEG